MRYILKIKEAVKEHMQAQPYMVICSNCSKPMKIVMRGIDKDNDVIVTVEPCKCKGDSND